MKTIQMHTTNELKSLARVNFHTMLVMLREKGISPILNRPTSTGRRTANYYGPDAYEFAKSIGDAKDAKKADKQARKEAWAARRAAAAEKKAEAQKRKEERQARLAAGLPVHGGTKKERQETPVEIIRAQLPVEYEAPVTGPSLRELVMETNRLLQEMIDFWKK